MGDEANPVLKITIKQELEAGQPRFTMTSENLTVPASEPLTSVPLDPTCRLSPIFSGGKYIKCAVPNCNNYFDGQRQEFMGISYFPFPEDPVLRKEWMVAIHLPPSTKYIENMKVCSNHFLTRDFATGPNVTVLDSVTGRTSLTKLNPDAKPSINIAKKSKFSVSKKLIKAGMSAMYDASGQFIGLDNPLMDTFGDAAAARSVSGKSRSKMPVITGVHSIGDSATEEAQGGGIATALVPDARDTVPRREPSTAPTFPPRRRGKSIRPPLEVADFLSGEEVITASDDSGTEARPSKNPEKGLIVVPASVKLPPRLPKVDLVGDSFSEDPTLPQVTVLREEVPPVVESSSAVPTEEPSVQSAGSTKQPDAPGTSRQLDEPGTSKQLNVTTGFDLRPHFRARRKRRNREEMRRQEEEEEWEPSFWRKRTLVREGFGEQLKADKKRKDETKLKYSSKGMSMCEPGSSAMDSSTRSEEDGLLREDEGWRVIEPISSNADRSGNEQSDNDDFNNPLSLLELSMGGGEDNQKQGQPSARRRPGPASKTCRPRYTPPTVSKQLTSDPFPTDSDDSESILSDLAKSGSGINSAVENGKPSNVDTDVYNSALLVDWSFFKSLVPDMGRLSHEKRMQLKSFILDTLNARIYEGKPISLQEDDAKPSDEIARSVVIAD